MEDFSLFVKELEGLFGEPDRQHRAEEELQALEMKDNYRVSRYITDLIVYDLCFQTGRIDLSLRGSIQDWQIGLNPNSPRCRFHV